MKLTVFVATIATLLLGLFSLVVRGADGEGGSRLGEKVIRGVIVRIGHQVR